MRYVRAGAHPGTTSQHPLDAITRDCPAKLRESVTESRRDEDCLVRVYCGRRRCAEEVRRQKKFFTLRNYGLCVDQMEDVGMDVDRVAGVLAKALAACYWVAGIDANDAEWVFGVPRAKFVSGVETETEKRVRADAEVFNVKDGDGRIARIWWCGCWISCVQPMSMDAAGVQQAVDAFYRNDPYFPRPWTNEYTDEDRRVWEVFREAFLTESDRILKPNPDVTAARRTELEWHGDLTWLWVRRIEREGRRRAVGKWVEEVEADRPEEEREVLLERERTVRAPAELQEKYEHLRIHTAGRGPFP